MRPPPHPAPAAPSPACRPRHDPASGRIVVDWLPETDVSRIDMRMIRHECTACLRPTSISHLRWIDCGGGGRVEGLGPPVLPPAGTLEEYGVEDPGITLIAGRIHVTFVAVSRHGIATALASESSPATSPWPALGRHGLILPPDNKDVVLFPDTGATGFLAVQRPELGDDVVLAYGAADTCCALAATPTRDFAAVLARATA